MGKNAQRRRTDRERSKRRTAQPSREEAGRPLPPPDLDDRLDEVVEVAASEPAGRRRDDLVDRLMQLGAPAAQAGDRALSHGVARAWSLGYTPAELLHVLGRRLSTDHVAVVAGAVLRTPSPEPTAAWTSQLDRIAAEWSGARVKPDALPAVVELVAALRRLGPVPPVTMSEQDDGLEDVILVRVRALLAKAESTEFDAEAEALTAKAQELITRHAIDTARLRRSSAGDQPEHRRILLHDPYLSSKLLLVHAVTKANRCEAVSSPDLGWSTVVGFPADLDATEMLVASLLAQCVGAMARLGPQRDARGRSRTRSFRTAFIRGFAVRIGQRLAEADAEVIRNVNDPAAVLPVLASRATEVGRAVEVAFPHVRTRRFDVGNAQGWASGVAAADTADLHGATGELRR